MTVHIRVRSYQSIEDAEIEVSGLTVVTGQNNSGKSAFLRAIYGAFTNARGTKFVRYGRDHCTVDVTFSDGNRVTWQKGEGGPCYEVNGKPLKKVGQGVPPEVEAFGVVPITAAGREIWPQFAPQFTGQVFLLDQPGSVLAESIADVTRVGVLNEALRQSQSDRRTLASELKVRQTDVLRLEALETGFVGLDLAEVLIVESDHLQVEVDGLQSQVAELRGLLDTQRALETVLGTLHPIRDLAFPDSPKDLVDELQNLSELGALRGKLELAVSALSDLSPIAEVPVPEEDLRLPKMVEVLGWLKGIQTRMLALGGIVGTGAGLREVVGATLPDTERVRAGIADLENCRQVRKNLQTCQSTVEALDQQIQTVTQQYEVSVHEVHGLLGEVGTCPVCGHG